MGIHYLILFKLKERKEKGPKFVWYQKGEDNPLIREDRELKAQRMNLSCSQTKRPKKLGVKEIKQVEETLGQGPAWNQYQWYPIVPFLFRVTGLGSETWWGLLIWIWAQMRPMFFRNSRVDLEQAGLTQKGRRSTKVQKSWSHGNVLPGRRSYVL